MLQGARHLGLSLVISLPAGPQGAGQALAVLAPLEADLRYSEQGPGVPQSQDGGQESEGSGGRNR